MAQNAGVLIQIPISAKQIKLPKGVNDRLRLLLDRQDSGKKLTAAEKKEADGLVELTEMLSLLRLKSASQDVEPKSFEESADLYAQLYTDDEELRELTESALLEPVND